ncbi:hypothetical protein Dsin_026695 [Dipteronia sinensis]|uniref:Insecticidal crystal toxin domain-containing protein n=1 Tax=Dipteronia sinensis TaxID=43782 RepID=A0AAD9ZYE6_9ROSI|nr:hypothetical protein Dsin_026695 [Dipteronia sinensis]
MYVTRPLSMYKKIPAALQSPPPEGPNSGILVILDEEAEPTCFFGTFKSNELPGLPFPQNKNLKIRHTTSTSNGSSSSYYKVVFIPALNQPLSSNLYYAIQPRGSHIGEAFESSKEEDKATCCFCSFVSDVNPQSFDPKNHFQQFEIIPRKTRGYFLAKSVDPDGIAPSFLRRKGWGLVTKTAHNLELEEAPGLDKELRSRLPDFDNLSLSNKQSSKPVIVGKWYIPFIFIKEGTLKDQMTRSMYYKTTLEQRWEQIFECDNNNGHNKDNVVVDVSIEREVVSLFGGNQKETTVMKSDHDHDERRVVDGVMWFKSDSRSDHVGLRSEIIERMNWEEERFGWVRGNERQVSVKREEQFGGVHGWKKFGCYVLVERFVLKRMDGSLLLTYDFKHSHHIRTKWE